MGLKHELKRHPNLDVTKYRVNRNVYKKRKREKEEGDSFARGYKYTNKECELILNSTYSDRELALMIGRQTSAIQTKRAKLKRRKK